MSDFFFIFFNNFFKKIYLFLHKFSEVVLYCSEFFQNFYSFYIIFWNLFHYFSEFFPFCLYNFFLKILPIVYIIFQKIVFYFFHYFSEGHFCH